MTTLPDGRDSNGQVETVDLLMMNPLRFHLSLCSLDSHSWSATPLPLFQRDHLRGSELALSTNTHAYREPRPFWVQISPVGQ